MADPSSTTQITGAEGLVKWFDQRRGFGFLIAPDGQDVFIHYSVIQGGGFRTLKDNAKVTYDAVRGDKGWKATRVERVPETMPDVSIPKPNPGYTRSPRR